jgi:hypothetical protein
MNLEATFSISGTKVCLRLLHAKPLHNMIRVCSTLVDLVNWIRHIYLHL